jgi:hypothetical protein
MGEGHRKRILKGKETSTTWVEWERGDRHTKKKGER